MPSAIQALFSMENYDVMDRFLTLFNISGRNISYMRFKGLNESCLWT